MRREQKQDWIVTALRRAVRWLREDTGRPVRELLKLEVAEIKKLPLWSILNLNASGGITRFPGSALQHNSANVTVLENVWHKGGWLNAGEVYTGYGPTYETALVRALQVANEMAHLRGS